MISDLLIGSTVDQKVLPIDKFGELDRSGLKLKWLIINGVLPKSIFDKQKGIKNKGDKWGMNKVSQNPLL